MNYDQRAFADSILFTLLLFNFIAHDYLIQHIHSSVPGTGKPFIANDRTLFS